VNGVTLALDVSGPSERGRLQVENPVATQFARDSYNLNGGDRRTWCPNDFQCVERVGITAQGGQGGATGPCPDGRFSYANSTTPHWVEFQVDGTQLTIATASPVPLPAAGLLLASGVGALAGLRRRRAEA
jgi:hypothetical protein